MTPLICGPLVCQLCEAEFVYDDDFASHQIADHAGESEYRKRVLWLLQQRGCQPITAQEKRLMVHNFVAFQQFSRIGSGGNTFHRGPEVPRCEAACAICAGKDFVEHRYKLNLFSEPPDAVAHKLHQGDGVHSGGESDGEAGTALLSLSNPASHRTLLQHRGVYYLQSPQAVHQILDVERYSKRWPLINACDQKALQMTQQQYAEELAQRAEKQCCG